MHMFLLQAILLCFVSFTAVVSVSGYFIMQKSKSQNFDASAQNNPNTSKTLILATSLLVFICVLLFLLSLSASPVYQY